MPSTTITANKIPALRTLKMSLRSLLNIFQGICGFVNKLSEVTSASQVTVRLEKLDELWEKVNDVILDIETHEDFTEEDDTYSNQRSEFGSKYYDIKSLLLDKIKEFEEPAGLNQSTRSPDTSHHPTTEHVRLPQIKLQTFDGNIDEWLSFRDLYTSLIHWKVDLPEVEKFHYLKGCLAGEAKTLVDSLAITRANYQIAWDTLTKRYNDSKHLKRRQVQALFKLPTLANESSTELQSLLEGFERAVQTLDQLVQPGDYKDLLLLDILSTRLDPVTRRSWEELSATKEQDSIKDLTEFLQRRVKVLESLPTKSSDYKWEPLQSKKPSGFHPSYSIIQTACGGCVACSEDHLLYQCPAFQQMSIPDRDLLLRNNGLCFNCFKRGHRTMDCPSRLVCRNCKGKHHTLVCCRPSSNEPSRSPSERTSITGSRTQSDEHSTFQRTPNQVASNVSGSRASSVLLATAIVIVEDEQGTRVPVRALLDSGSECNFMTDRFSQKLKVQRQRSNISLYGIGQASMQVKGKIAATIKSRFTGFSRRMEFLLLPNVTANLPIANVDIAGWEVPAGVELADPTFFKSNAVDLVLGIQHFFAFFEPGNEIPLGEGLPTLKESVFGWVVSGCVEESHNNRCVSCNIAVGLQKLNTQYGYTRRQSLAITQAKKNQPTRCSVKSNTPSKTHQTSGSYAERIQRKGYMKQLVLDQTGYSTTEKVATGRQQGRYPRWCDLPRSSIKAANPINPRA